MSNVLLTAGAIGAKLDSVKYLSNKFKGGLAVKTAESLAQLGHNVTVLHSKHNKIQTNLKTIEVDDVFDYFNYIKNCSKSNSFDSFILAAAVANLAPTKPYEGKFPSHNYKVGDTFDIQFCIAPRIIDEIKKLFPISSLIGYKLYDGNEEDLIKAAKLTLFESKANIVFANNPEWAKDKKISLTQDGAVWKIDFEEHITLIHKLLSSKFYKTILNNFNLKLNDIDKKVINTYPTYNKDNRNYGTFAIRKDNNSFITTTRGKNTGITDFSYINNINHDSKIIYANKKATLNAPLLDMLFRNNSNINILYHGHKLTGEIIHNEYEFAGTDKELIFAKIPLIKNQPRLLPQHGFIVGFENLEDYLYFINNSDNL